MPDLTGGMSLVFTNMSWLPGQRAWAIELSRTSTQNYRCAATEVCYYGSPWYADDGTQHGHPEGAQFVLVVSRDGSTLRVDGTDEGFPPNAGQQYDDGVETASGTLTFDGTFVEPSTGRTANFELTSCVNHPDAPACGLLPQ